jgi:hypothetical protein
MSPAVTCKQCGFQATIGLSEGRLASLSLDQAQMMKRCRWAREPGFAFDCSDLASALLAALENIERTSRLRAFASRSSERH